MPTTTLNLPVKHGGQTLGTAVMTVKERDIDVVASIAATDISLPAGRYLLTTTICSKPTDFAYPTNTKTLDTTLASTGTVSAPASDIFHAHKDFESNLSGKIIGMVDVKVWDGNGWRSYATSWQSEDASAVSFVACGPAKTDQLRGANVHMLAADISQSATKTTPLLDALVDLGADTVRTSLAWCFMNQSQGVIDPVYQSEVDKFLGDCADRGLKVIAPFGQNAPPWAAPSRPIKTITTAWNNKTYQYTLYGPDDMQNLADGVNAFLDRWGSQIYAFEVGNEPNPPTSFYSDTAAKFVAMTQTIYNTVKASAYPNIKVICGALAYSDTDYMQQLYDGGIKGYYDAISVHPYHYYFFDGGGGTILNPRQPMPEPNFFHCIAAVADFRELQLANGDTAPIWITETGFSSPQNLTGTSAGFNLSEQDQGDYLRYALRQLARLPYVEVVQLHTTENAGPLRNNWQNNFGLVRVDHITQKPAYDVVKATWAGLKAGTL